jgi:hypothetical protein
MNGFTKKLTKFLLNILYIYLIMSYINFINKYINSNGYKFITPYFNLIINNVVDETFPNLNETDKNNLKILTNFIIDIISYKYHFKKDNKEYYEQWTQNKNRDIKGAILLLIPFIDDRDDGVLLKKLKNLNHLLFVGSGNEKEIPRSLSKLKREDMLPRYFEYGNLALGLIKNNEPLKLIWEEEGIPLIYKIIYHKLIGLLQTLEIINGKSYINWINIVPLNINNYLNSQIFKTTDVFLDNLEKQKNNDERLKLLANNLLYYDGLWVGDFYNIFRKKYFEDSKKIKWLIFPYEISETNKIYLIQGLHKMINLEKILNSYVINYDDLLLKDQISFDKQIDNVFLKLNNNQTITGSYRVDMDILKYLFIYLINNYSKLNELPNLGTIDKFRLIQIFTEETEENDDFNKKEMNMINQIQNSDILNILKISEIKKHIYNYLIEALDYFKLTPYGKFLITQVKDNIDNSIFLISNEYYYLPLVFKNNNLDDINREKYNAIRDKINLKNIYNIAKTISHTNKLYIEGEEENRENIWRLLSENYLSLEEVHRLDFFKKIFSEEPNWLNLRANIQKQKLDTIYDYNTEITKIKDTFKICYKYIIFEELITTGLLNKFEPVLNITNKEILPTSADARIDVVKKLLENRFNKYRNDWLESYYYLTNQKFKFLKKMRLEKKKLIYANDKYDENFYFDQIYKDHGWPSFYAMDWISQISFFNHYIYHQVMYVTGATGQGKSTQVPKLFLYATKMIDYRTNGKVVTTAPRISPLLDNATRIAEELGVPIEQVTNEGTSKIRLNNYYVQYKYSDGSHSKPVNHGFISETTDGTLIENLKTNPTMFETLKNTNVKQYINKNVYDVIILDEAHEHNINMDLILTLSRQSCYYNNKIRLVVTSATMDDDEPIYRRYFIDNNDKLLFPIKVNQLKNPFDSYKPNFFPDPFYMDRRYHISPPGETTQYRVDEFYLDYNPMIIQDNVEDMRASAKKAQELGYKKIREICENPSMSTGEILFFANGKKEIIDAVKYLNEILPPGNVALPYFAELNLKYKNIISKIDIRISGIKNKRERIYEEWGPTYIEDPTIPSGIYKRSIIVATNVAEASVTIPNLKFVVDNGYAKENKYFPKLNKVKLIVDKISESSRKQRKGRVGRRGDGTVYYMYKKDARKDIKPKYKVTQEEIAEIFLGLLGSQTKEEIENPKLSTKLEILNDFTNPNIYGPLYKFRTFNNTDKELYYAHNTRLFDLYEINYSINYVRYIKDDQSYYNNMTTPIHMITRDNGQIINNLLDKTGSFYLISHFENNIIRNYLNEIIEYKKDDDIIEKTNQINDDEYRYILLKLVYNFLLIDSETNSPYYMDLSLKNRKLIKSELAEKCLELKTSFEINLPTALIYLSSSAMNCLIPVMEIQLLLNIINNSLINLAPKESLKNWNRFTEIYSSSQIYSDLIFLYELIIKIKKAFSYLILFQLDNYSTKFDKIYDEKLETFKKMYEKYGEYNKNYESIDLWNKFMGLKNKGELQNKYKEVFKKDSPIKNILYDDIQKNKARIDKWAQDNFIDSDIINKYLIELANFNLKFSEELKTNETIKWISKIYKGGYSNNLTNYTIEEKIVRSFLYGNSFNVTLMNTYDGDIIPRAFINSIVYQVLLGYPNKMIIQKNKDLKKFTLINTSEHYVFFMNYEEFEESNKDAMYGYILTQVNPQIIMSVNPLFFSPLFNPIYTKLDNTLYIKSNAYLDSFNIEKNNGWNNIKNIWDHKDMPLLSEYIRRMYIYFTSKK